MNKMYALKDLVAYIIMAVLLVVAAIFLLIFYREETKAVIIVYLCIAFFVAALLKIFYFYNHIVISNDTIRVFDFPFFATNKYYEGNRSLILWNNEIHLSEIKDVELVKLTRDEQKAYVGYAHLFSKYIKVSFKNSGGFKYICVSSYTNSQIKSIIKLLTKKT